MKNKNNLNLLFIIIMLLFLACTCPKPQERQTSQASTSPTAANVTMTPAQSTNKALIDIPKLIGKSQSEIIKILGKPKRITQLNKTDKTGEVSFDYEYSGGEYWINFKNGKADYFHIPANKEYATAKEFGEIVGLDLSNSPDTENAAVNTYSGNISNISWFKITVSKSGEGFTILTAQKTP